jgi:hypothetical protein
MALSLSLLILLGKLNFWVEFILGFPTGRDSATFRDKGTEAPSLSRDKGTTGQAKNLAKGRDGPGQPKSGTGHGTKQDRAEKDVLKQENDFLKQKMMF